MPQETNPIQIKMTKFGVEPVPANRVEGNASQVFCLYGMSVLNVGTESFRIIGKKLILKQDGKQIFVWSSDAILGHNPELRPGQLFSFVGGVCVQGNQFEGTYVLLVRLLSGKVVLSDIVAFKAKKHE